MERNKYKRFFKYTSYIFLAVLIALVMLTGVFQIPPHPATAGDGESANVTPGEPFINGHWADGLKLPPFEPPEMGNPRLDSQLNRLMEQQAALSAQAFSPENTGNYTIAVPDEEVTVVVECLPGQIETVTQAAGMYGTFETSYENLIQIKVPVSRLSSLAKLPDVQLVRMPWPMIPFSVSEGKNLINADDWNAQGLTGTGVKVGILDPGFTGYTALLGTDLPATVTLQPLVNINGSTNHGTACAEIIYDIAPDAQFFFAKAATDVEMGTAVNWLITQGVNVISCSAGFSVGGPGDGTGIICNMVTNARNNSILWSQSAGNNAESHWYGNWADTDSNGYLDFVPGVVELIPVYLYTTTPISVYLKWNDPWSSSGNNYGLRLFDSGLSIVAESDYPQNGNDNPIESFTYTTATDGWYYIAVGSVSPNPPETFHVYCYPYSFGEPALMVASSSLCIPADSPNAMTVGAVYFATPGTIEDFSSQGPTDDGRIKPDLVAPDGVSNVTIDPFYGTSASAPHAAGAAVLVKQLFPAYNPTQIQAFLENRAVDLGSGGKDNTYGSGRLDLPALYNLEILPSNEGDTTPASGNYTHPSGTVVNLSAAPDPGWHFMSWSGDTGTIADVSDATTTITMSDNYTITANFGFILDMAVSGNGTTTPATGSHLYSSGANVTVNAVPAANWEFTTWDGDVWNSLLATTNITMNSDKNVTANFTRVSSNLTMEKFGTGTVVPEVGEYNYPVNTTVSINATPAQGWRFGGWTGDNITIDDTSSNETTILMDSDYTITAFFDRPVLTMAVSGSGNVSPDVGPHPYLIDTVVDISANASTKWVFTNWIGDVGTVANPDIPSTNITMNDDHSISANFTRTHGTVILDVSGNGTAEMSPVSDNASTYAIDTLVSINATAGQGWRFAGWTGDIQDLDNSALASTNMTINNDYAITAVFDQPVLTLTASGSGTVSMSPVTANNTYPVGSSVNITATPASGYRFVNWTGNISTVANVNSASTNVTMNDDYTITANFAVIPQDPGGGGPGGGGGSGGVDGKTTTSLRGSSSSTGVVWANIQAVSMDTKTTLDIPYGTKCTNANGNALTSITITELSEPDAAQTAVTIVGTVYEFGPRGASFNPPITLTIEYDDDNLPSGTPESALSTAIWDMESKTYKKVDCQVNTETNRITASISHFSRYTIISAPRPAAFTLSGLSVSPANVKAGDTVNISVTVRNTGDVSGNYTCSVSVNGVTKSSKSVTVGAGAQTNVSFSVTAEGSDSCTVSVGSLNGTFTVIVLPASFKVDSLAISPAELDIGGKATVSVTVTNTGGAVGTYLVNLNINGTTADTKEVSLSGGASEKVSFTVTGNAAGKATIDVNGLAGSLVVLEVKTTPTTPQPVSTTPIITTPIQTTTSTPVTPPAKTNWGLIIGIIAGVAVVTAGCVLYFVWWRNR
jgi:hypothetical protein